MSKVVSALSVAVLACACGSTSPREDLAGPSPVEEQPQDAGSEGAAAQGMGEAELQDEWGRLTLADQKKAYLLEQHLAKAEELAGSLHFDAAELELARALELDPDNLRAKLELAEIHQLQGKDPRDPRGVGEVLINEHRLKSQQVFESAKDDYRKASVLQARGDYDAAITELELCLDKIRFAPYSVDWQGLDKDARALLESVQSQRDEASAAARGEVERSTRDALRAEEEAEGERRKAQVASRLEKAIASFRSRNYDDAIHYAEEALALDPRDEKALDLRDTAFRAGRKQVREEFLTKKREEYLRWQESIEELKVPYNDVITLPNQEFWQKITDLRSRRRGLDLESEVSQGDAELSAKLSQVRIPYWKVEEQESLTTVVNGLAAISQLPILCDPAADEAAVTEGVVYSFELANPLTVEKVLNLITQMSGESVTWTVRHEAVLVTTKEKARGKLVVYNHDVQDLIFGLTDFLGPKIDRIRLIDELEDDEGGGPFGGIGEKPKMNEPDDLVTLVQENVDSRSWESDGVAISIEAGNMVVVHTAETQAAIRRFLEDLRRFSGSLVTIESKFLTIKDNAIQEIGVDFRGLDNPGSPFTDLDDLGLGGPPSQGLDNLGRGDSSSLPSSGFFFDDGGDGSFGGRSENYFENPLGQALSNIGGLTAQLTFLNDLNISAILRLVEKSEQAEIINDQVLSVHNTQRAFVTVINQQAYVQDFDVEVAQFEAVADPQINVLTEGIVLDVRPTIHHNRQYLTLEVQPTVARVVALVPFSTTLAGQTAAVTFELPELEVQSVYTTAVVPDGGTILIGGLTRLRNVERRAEVPWVANIPLVGFFFKEEGTSDEKESLMIMLKAWISDVRSELAALER